MAENWPVGCCRGKEKAENRANEKENRPIGCCRGKEEAKNRAKEKAEKSS